MVIIPDYFRGKICDVSKLLAKGDFAAMMTFLKTETVWNGKLKDDWEKSILPYATQNGAKSFGVIGKHRNKYIRYNNGMRVHFS